MSDWQDITYMIRSGDWVAEDDDEFLIQQNHLYGTPLDKEEYEHEKNFATIELSREQWKFVAGVIDTYMEIVHCVAMFRGHIKCKRKTKESFLELYKERLDQIGFFAKNKDARKYNDKMMEEIFDKLWDAAYDNMF